MAEGKSQEGKPKWTARCWVPARHRMHAPENPSRSRCSHLQAGNSSGLQSVTVTLLFGSHLHSLVQHQRLKATPPESRCHCEILF